jgi:hypothetical protein
MDGFPADLGKVVRLFRLVVVLGDAEAATVEWGALLFP